MELSKGNKPLNNYYLYSLILTILFIIAGLFSLFWGTSYLYGALFGALGTILSISTTLLLSKRMFKSPYWTSFLSFITKVGIWSLVLLMPMFTFNSWNNPLGGVSLLYSEVNLIFAFVGLSIPMIASILVALLRKRNE